MVASPKPAASRVGSKPNPFLGGFRAGYRFGYPTRGFLKGTCGIFLKPSYRVREAVKGVDGIIRTGSTFQFVVKDQKKDLLQPAICGTTAMLRAAHAHSPQVTRIVIISSFAAMIHLRKGLWPEHSYSEDD
ncbi:hypothetical protein BO82DRAFT_363117 [Aspergillus uvarum CBS 121591]|uniref:NAD(P)-binding protein n=1 Tax=Aspergillus uvarum CBS 121591 TaxID=1448315 RepID=A0A319D6H4_9EURO|nr:hypothetical protein BO82DRAFT_363117 [Aspergillus uvarum CBS 121591]PYH83538.1 hypothetical protein BO82DRAFT_363117 [Aspergillus uvarum CBS 121591]